MIALHCKSVVREDCLLKLVRLLLLIITSQSRCSLSLSFLPVCTGISGRRLTGLTGESAVPAASDSVTAVTA